MAKSSSKAAAQAAATTKKPSAQRAAEICKSLGVSEVWANDSGEYFTEENRALLSVNQDKKRITKFTPSLTEEDAKPAGNEGDGGEEKP